VPLLIEGYIQIVRRDGEGMVVGGDPELIDVRRLLPVGLDAPGQVLRHPEHELRMQVRLRLLQEGHRPGCDHLLGQHQHELLLARAEVAQRKVLVRRVRQEQLILLEHLVANRSQPDVSVLLSREKTYLTESLAKKIDGVPQRLVLRGESQVEEILEVGGHLLVTLWSLARRELLGPRLRHRLIPRTALCVARLHGLFRQEHATDPLSHSIVENRKVWHALDQSGTIFSEERQIKLAHRPGVEKLLPSRRTSPLRFNQA
jgi:hypothetical protein